MLEPIDVADVALGIAQLQSQLDAAHDRIGAQQKVVDAAEAQAYCRWEPPKTPDTCNWPTADVCPGCALRIVLDALHSTTEDTASDKVLVHIPKPGGGHQTYEVRREPSSPHQPTVLHPTIEKGTCRNYHHPWQFHPRDGACIHFQSLPVVPTTEAAVEEPTQAQVIQWRKDRNLPTTPKDAALKLGEEAGEVQGAVVKMPEGRKTLDDLFMELGQLGICAMGLAEVTGLDFRAAIATEWQRMGQPAATAETAVEDADCDYFEADEEKDGEMRCRNGGPCMDDICRNTGQCTWALLTTGERDERNH